MKPKARYQAAKPQAVANALKDNAFRFRQRENLDTEHITFTMLRL